MVIRYALLIILVSLVQVARSDGQTEAEKLEQSVEELRNSVGQWSVVTESLKEDGSIASSTSGTYEFSWIVPDRVVGGKSEIPELKQASGLLLYINEKQGHIEMVSVSGDGNLWIMTGPLGGDQRLSQEFARADGGMRRLRFTRFNVTKHAFESRMEFTDDGGKTWKPGNHQTFRRKTAKP